MTDSFRLFNTLGKRKTHQQYAICIFQKYLIYILFLKYAFNGNAIEKKDTTTILKLVRSQSPSRLNETSLSLPSFTLKAAH